MIIESLKSLPQQFIDLQKQSNNFSLPKKYRNPEQIIICGMGGSNLAGRVVQSALEQELKVPLLINPNYELPGWTNKKTLVICSSYSGTTEEVLAAYQEAKKHGAKIVALSSAPSLSLRAERSNLKNNKLATWAKKDGYPALLFTDAANPAGQPRLGLGYSLAGLLLILQAAGALKISRQTLANLADKLSRWGNQLLPTKSNNAASKLAHKLTGKNIILVTGEFLQGSAYALRNQLNETSKNFAACLTLPDANHFALEGLQFPKDNNLTFLFFSSTLDSPRVQQRLKLTMQSVKKHKLEVVEHALSGKTKLEQAAELLQLGSWISFYLAQLNRVDPLAIPTVDWFKQQLK